MSPKDTAVIKAFLAHEAGESRKLATDGKRLDGRWMGGTGIAEWGKGHVYFSDLGSSAAAKVQKAVVKMAKPGVVIEGDESVEVPPEVFIESIDLASDRLEFLISEKFSPAYIKRETETIAHMLKMAGEYDQDQLSEVIGSIGASLLRLARVVKSLGPDFKKAATQIDAVVKTLSRDTGRAKKEDMADGELDRGSRLDEAAPREVRLSMSDQADQNVKHRRNERIFITPQLYDWVIKKFAGKGSYTATKKADAIRDQELVIHRQVGRMGSRMIIVKVIGEYLMVKDDEGGEFGRGKTMFFDTGGRDKSVSKRGDKFVIMKSSRDYLGGKGYSEPETCKEAGVKPGTVYPTWPKARAAAKKLAGVNPVGFAIFVYKEKPGESEDPIEYVGGISAWVKNYPKEDIRNPVAPMIESRPSPSEKDWLEEAIERTPPVLFEG